MGTTGSSGTTSPATTPSPSCSRTRTSSWSMCRLSSQSSNLEKTSSLHANKDNIYCYCCLFNAIYLLFCNIYQCRLNTCRPTDRQTNKNPSPTPKKKKKKKKKNPPPKKKKKKKKKK